MHPMQPNHRPSLILSAVLTMLAGVAANAQQVPSPEPVTHPAESLGLDTVVVTGTASGRSKLSAPFAISTINESQIERSAPTSTVDLLRRVPGFSVEASGGQGGGQNIYARGLPGGGWYYVQLQENGLTLFDEPQESFFNIDTLNRVDAMTERVEVVRGGTSPIFANNAPGGTVNFMTRHGTPAAEGSFKVTAGSHGLQRFDGYTSGPVNDHLTYAVGGFFRADKGERETGYTADKGGQFTAAASLRLDDGHLNVEAKLLNDRTAFYTGIPLNDPRNPSVSLAGLLDPSTGTLASNDLRHVVERSFFGTTPTLTNRDLADGIHTDLKQFNATLEQGLGDGWRMNNRFGMVDAKVSYDAIFSGAAPQDAGAYLNGKLTAARTGFGSSVASVGYVLNSTGAAFNPATTNGLVLESQFNSTDTSVRTVSDDLRLNKSFDLALGRQDLTLGIYYSRFKFEQYRQPNTILTSLRNQADLLNVLAYDASGNVMGSVTENGFVRYGNGVVKGDADGSYLSPYVANAWQVSEKLALDAGMRYTAFNDSGRNYAAGTANQGAAALATTNVGGLTGAYTDKQEKLSGNTWTVGASYLAEPKQQLFSRFTRSVRFPRLQNIYLLQTNPVTNVDQLEAGWRSVGPLSFSAVGFWSHFDHLTLNGLVLDPTDGVMKSLPLVGETKTKGMEAELNWRASSLFNINANVTLQNPNTKSLSNLTTGASGTLYENKQISQIPKIMASIQPVFNLVAANTPVELSATISHVGERYVDYANTTKLPSYTTVDIGLLATISTKVDMQFTVHNVTNSQGLTEGNPRADVLAGQGTATAIYGRPIFGRNFAASINYRW